MKSRTKQYLTDSSMLLIEPATRKINRNGVQFLSLKEVLKRRIVLKTLLWKIIAILPQVGLCFTSNIEWDTNKALGTNKNYWKSSLGFSCNQAAILMNFDLSARKLYLIYICAFIFPG